MARTLVHVLILLTCGLPISVSQAQLFRGNAAPPAAREPARVGLLGGLREAREERIRREEQALTAAARAAAAQRTAAANPRANSAATGSQTAAVANNISGREAAQAATQSLGRDQRNLDAAKADPNSRTANFRGPGTAPRSQNNLGLANANTKASNTLSRPTPVTPASATSFVPEPVGYDGPGVLIRLPKDARSLVNYLVDDVDTNVIRPGEQQVLNSKGSYVVRYSRGVTADGRSFGESRYAITEGRYRFELTATGWELYREPDADLNTGDLNIAPPNRLDIAESLPGDSPAVDLFIPEPSSQSELKRLMPSASTEQAPSTPKEPVASEPVSNEPASNEEVLPAPKPRSILE